MSGPDHHKPNYYWPVYKNLEKEVLNLSTEIHFSDEIKEIEEGISHCQLYTCLIKIAELIYRVCAEIESVAKSLYKREGGEKSESGTKQDPFFDSDCLKFLNKQWDLDKKEVVITAPSFYFFQDENRILTPLCKADKQGKAGSDWKQAYQAVKHDRVEELHRANVKHLVRSLAALFLLNVYYKNEERLFGISRHENMTSLGSEIFSVKIHTCLLFSVEADRRCLPQLLKCVYMQRFTGERFNAEMKKEKARHQKRLIEIEALLRSTEELKGFFAGGGKYAVENLPTIIREVSKPLVYEMNKQKTFEEKKSFVINRPQYKKFNDVFFHKVLKQVFPDQKVNFKKGSSQRKISNKYVR